MSLNSAVLRLINSQGFLNQKTLILLIQRLLILINQFCLKQRNTDNYYNIIVFIIILIIFSVGFYFQRFCCLITDIVVIRLCLILDSRMILFSFVLFRHNLRYLLLVNDSMNLMKCYEMLGTYGIYFSLLVVVLIIFHYLFGNYFMIHLLFLFFLYLLVLFPQNLLVCF